MPNPTDFIQRVTLNGSGGAVIEVIAGHDCDYVTVRQLPSEAQVIITVKHQSAADAAANTEEIPAGGLWEKGRDGFNAQAKHQIRAGDTIGWFRSGTAATPIIVVREHTAG